MLFINMCINSVILCEDVVEFTYVYVMLSVQLFYPIIGWLADAKIGRYKVIVCSMVLMSVACVCLTIAWTVSNWYGLSQDNMVVGIVLFSCMLFANLSVISFRAVALPFITDQMIGASGDQLATAIDWYVCGTYFIPTMTSWAKFSIISVEIYRLLVVLTILISLALAVSCMFLCHHHLDKQPYITNPIRDIASVLNYARKNKCPKNRSALTYWENKTPSRLDLGMEKYGGPFTEEQVEDVKTTLRLLLLIFTISLTQLFYEVPYTPSQKIPYLHSLYAYPYAVLAAYMIPTYYLLIQPVYCRNRVKCCLSKLKLSMIKVLGVGIIMCTCSFLGYLILDLVSHDVTTTTGTCRLTVEANTPSYCSVLILNCIDGLGSTLITLKIIKFIIAQMPHKMKGLALTIFYGLHNASRMAGLGLYEVLEYFMFPKCSLYYCLTQLLISCVVMVLYVVVSRWYRLRSRNNPINIYNVVETHVARNLDREQEYFRENDITTHSISYGTLD